MLRMQHACLTHRHVFICKRQSLHIISSKETAILRLCLADSIDSTPFIVTFKSEIVCTIVAVCSFCLCTQWTGTGAFLSFQSSVAEDYILLGHRAASLGNGIPTFRGKILPSSLRVEVPKCLFVQLNKIQKKTLIMTKKLPKIACNYRPPRFADQQYCENVTRYCYKFPALKRPAIPGL